MSNSLNIRSAQRGCSGDYWGQLKGESLKLAKTLTQLSSESSISTATHYLGELSKRRKFVTNRYIRFSKVHYAEINWDSREVVEGEIIRRPSYDAYDNSVYVYLAEGGPVENTHPIHDEVAQPSTPVNRREPLYLIHAPNIYPISIRVSTGILSAGTGFYIRAPYLIFREDPAKLFPDNVIPVIAAEEIDATLFDYVHEISHSSHPYYVSRFLRGDNSPKGLCLALNSIAGSFVPEKDTEIEEFINIPDYCQFVRTPDGFYRVHPFSEVGRSTTSPAAIPNPYLVKVYHSSSVLTALGRASYVKDFFGKGYPLPTGQSQITVEGGVVKIIDDDPRVQTWNDSRSSGDVFSVFMTGELGLQEGDTIGIDLGEYLIMDLYRDVVVLIEIDEQKIGEINLDELRWFMDRHKPLHYLQLEIEPKSSAQE